MDPETDATLSSAELEECFADLQEAMKDKNAAIDKVERLEKSEPGTEEYDDIFPTQGTDAGTRALIQDMVSCPSPTASM